MANLIIAQNPLVQSVKYTLPNKHYVPVDMKYKGIDNMTPLSVSFRFVLFACSVCFISWYLDGLHSSRTVGSQQYALDLHTLIHFENCAIIHPCTIFRARITPVNDPRPPSPNDPAPGTFSSFLPLPLLFLISLLSQLMFVQPLS